MFKGGAIGGGVGVGNTQPLLELMQVLGSTARSLAQRHQLAYKLEKEVIQLLSKLGKIPRLSSEASE